MEATDDISNSSEVGFRSFVSYCVDSGGAQALSIVRLFLNSVRRRNPRFVRIVFS